VLPTDCLSFVPAFRSLACGAEMMGAGIFLFFKKGVLGICLMERADD